MKLLSYPKRIIPGHKLNFLLQDLNIDHTGDITDPGITHVIHSDYKNVNEVSLEVLNLDLPIINKGCTNVKKDYVDEVFTKVFGYSSFIDPEKHRGCCVEKSSQQAIHNGRIVKCPMKPDLKEYPSKHGVIHKRVYQKMIDTRFEMDKIREFRVPIINHGIPIIFVKELGVNSMFHPHKENYYNVYVANVYEWFDCDEIGRMIDFSKEFSFEFGEIDVLRDNSTGLVYIVDVNNIPMGSLFSHLKDKKKAISLLASSFKKLLCK
jgi:hypothetical protein